MELATLLHVRAIASPQVRWQWRMHCARVQLNKHRAHCLSQFGVGIRGWDFCYGDHKLAVDLSVLTGRPGDDERDESDTMVMRECSAVR